MAPYPRSWVDHRVLGQSRGADAHPGMAVTDDGFPAYRAPADDSAGKGRAGPDDRRDRQVQSHADPHALPGADVDERVGRAVEVEQVAYDGELLGVEVAGDEDRE